MRALHCSALLAVLVGAACDQTSDGHQPVGGAVPTDAEIERYIRRLHLDLSARPPTDDELATERQRIVDGGAATAIRRTLAEELIGQPAFADTFVAELENRVYGGDTAAGQYDFLCFLVRNDPCGCADPVQGEEICGGTCTCPLLADLAAERAALATAAADLAGGASTSAIERRYADTTGFGALLGGPDAIATNLIEVFLGRTPQGEELENAAAMVNGGLAADAPAGLLYHRHGANYPDLIDIIFTSEIYREAMVSSAFERYLGRPPTPPELRHFAGVIDPADPDLRPVIVAITSSREYVQP